MEEFNLGASLEELTERLSMKDENNKENTLPGEEIVTEVTEVTVDSEENKNSYSDTDLFPLHPFPFEALPERLLSVINNFADALHVERELIACSMLTILSDAIGNSLRVKAKQGYEVPPFCWLIVVADSGYGKSPAINTLMKPLEWLQGSYYQDYKEQQKIYEANLRIAKKSKDMELPEPPRLRQTYAQDTTIEALADIFEGDSRGTLLYLDEIAALVLGFGQYKQAGSGNDREQYLSMYNASSLKINRKTGVRFIPNTGLSILGGIQSVTMPSIFDSNCFFNGLLPRFLLLNLENKPSKFSLAEIRAEDTSYWEMLINICYEIPLVINDKGFVDPKKIALSEDALRAYIEHYNLLENTACFLSDSGKPFISKILTYCLKFAGILHVLHSIPPRASISIEIPDAISLETMKNAIELTQFFIGQAMNTLTLYGTKKEGFNECEKRLIRVLCALRDKVSNGKLKLGEIVSLFNDSIPEKLQLTSEKVSGILNNKLGLVTQKSTGNLSFLLWEKERIEKLFLDSTVTTVTTKDQIDGAIVTEGTEVTVDLEEEIKNTDQEQESLPGEYGTSDETITLDEFEIVENVQ